MQPSWKQLGELESFAMLHDGSVRSISHDAPARTLTIGVQLSSRSNADVGWYGTFVFGDVTLLDARPTLDVLSSLTHDPDAYDVEVTRVSVQTLTEGQEAVEWFGFLHTYPPPQHRPADQDIFVLRFTSSGFTWAPDHTTGAAVAQPAAEAGTRALEGQTYTTPNGIAWHVARNKENQLAKRGWTVEHTSNVIDNPAPTADNPTGTEPAVDRTTGEPATKYFGTDGHYVVVNDRTGEIVQVSDRTRSDWRDGSQIITPRPRLQQDNDG